MPRQLLFSLRWDCRVLSLLRPSILCWFLRLGVRKASACSASHMRHVGKDWPIGLRQALAKYGLALHFEILRPSIET
jgi:hypothetical protein